MGGGYGSCPATRAEQLGDKMQENDLFDLVVNMEERGPRSRVRKLILNGTEYEIYKGNFSIQVDMNGFVSVRGYGVPGEYKVPKGRETRR